jgi:hypothetical protein
MASRTIHLDTCLVSGVAVLLVATQPDRDTSHREESRDEIGMRRIGRRLPLMDSRISSSLLARPSASSARADMIWPGVQ